MLRSATVAELRALLFGLCGKTLGGGLGSRHHQNHHHHYQHNHEGLDDAAGTGQPSRVAAEQAVREALVDLATSDHHLRKLVAAHFASEGGSENVAAIVSEVARGVLSVLERDLLQLMHGSRAEVLTGHEGLQFLLAGIILGELYRRVPDKDDPFDAIILKILLAYTDQRVWSCAVHSRCQTIRTAARVAEEPRPQGRRRANTHCAPQPRKRVSPKLRRRTPPQVVSLQSGTDPSTCPQCYKEFKETRIVQRCPCGATSVFYWTQPETHQPSTLTKSMANLADVPEIVEEDAPEDEESVRARASSV
eukprot:m.143310 g.143310  ORF g.143310 m.143310 type:complete len:306 (-) comp17162_c1_seq3:1406-2323(-)